MINEPVRQIQNYIDAGSDIVTVHAEVCDESSFGEIHDLLKSNKVGIGLAINPDTTMPEWSKKFISSLDQIIVMSVVPGKSGQKYIETTHEKIKNLMENLKENGFTGYVEADGGVTLDNIGECFADGARAFVGGSAIIGQSDVRLVIREFRNQVLRTRRKLLIQKANEFGGTELVNKWIDLHIVGKKKDELIQIATELGYK